MLQRILTSFILLFIGAIVIFYGGIHFWIWITLVTLICTYELLLMLKKQGYRVFPFLSTAIITGIMLCLIPIALKCPNINVIFFQIWQSLLIKITVVALILFYCLFILFYFFFFESFLDSSGSLDSTITSLLSPLSS